jgi:hypothetical protein
VIVGFALGAVGCLPTRTNRLPPEGDGGTSPPPIQVDGGNDSGAPPDVKPHAVLGIDPPHGPFSGGTLAAIRGNGFGGNARVWFGEVEVPAEDVVALDPQRLQVTSPPGPAGAADIVVQNGDDTSTRVSLAGGFVYDDLYLEPLSGPTVGGTLVTVHADAPLFSDDTAIEIDLEPCEVEKVVSPTELTCRTPPGSPGSKSVRAVISGEDGEAQSVDVLDAYTYVISDDGFRGGLGGDPIDGELSVLVLDNVFGKAVPDATVLIGTDAESALRARTDRFGTAVISSDELGTKPTVTIAKPCFQPMTFVDVPVDRVTVFLNPVLSPACGAEGDIPAGGGTPGRGASVSGEIVWPLDGELRDMGWENIPTPQRDTEKKVGYVFRLATRATDDFSLPSAVGAITPSSTGDHGYSYYLSTSPGNFTLYALVGVEDRSRSPYRFTPYAMGLTRGVNAAPSQVKNDVFIQIDMPLDHALSIDANGPKPTSRGPDRMQATLAIEVGNQGYILLPNGKLESLLPSPGAFRFVGVPPLAGSLTGARYVATAAAYTGSARGAPMSAVGLFASVTSSETLGLGAFLELPQVDAPASSTTWNGHSFAISRASGGPRPDLTIVDVSSGSGLVTWRIVAPGSVKTLEVPDLGSLSGDLGIVSGPITVQVTIATVDDFSYGSLENRQLGPRGWRSYARDVSFASY